MAMSHACDGSVAGVVRVIRRRSNGWQVLVYTGLDPLTGKQRYISRQVNGSHRQAQKEEARLKTEVAERWGWIPFNPALVVRPESGRGQPRMVPTAEQVGQLFVAVADDPEFTAFLRLSATTGLRPGAVCALRWSDLDLEAAEVSVNANIVTTKGLPDGYLRKPPKSEHGARVLALDPGTVEALRAHQALRALIVRELEGDALTARPSPPGRKWDCPTSPVGSAPPPVTRCSSTHRGTRAAQAAPPPAPRHTP
jgi:integrase